MAARNHTLNTTGNSALMATQPQVLAQARTPALGAKRAYPKLVQPEQRGNRRIDDSGNGRDRSVSPLAGSENPQSLKAGNPPQPNSCHGVLTSSNRMRNCTAQNRGGMMHDSENRAREDSIACHAITPK